MITEKLKELTLLREKTAALETEIAAAQSTELAGLPAQYGFESANDFIAAVRTATDGRKSRRGRPAGKAKAAPTAVKGKRGRRRRANITDETRAEVKKLVEGGKKGAEIAKTLKISLPSVQNIKKALGLVQKRKK